LAPVVEAGTTLVAVVAALVVAGLFEAVVSEILEAVVKGVTTFAPEVRDGLAAVVRGVDGLELEDATP